MSKSDRAKAEKAEFEARKDRLRASLTIGANGKILKPGSREYERELESLMRSLSPAELDELIRKPPHA